MKESLSTGMIALRLSAIALACFTGTASAQFTYNTVALSGATGSALGFGPNLGAGVNFSGSSIPVLNSSGQVAFNGILTGTGVGTFTDTGIWTNAGGTLAVVAREGTIGPGPNVGAGVNFGPFNNTFYFPVFNAAGHVAFQAELTGTGVDSSNGRGIWTNVGGTLNAVARNGTAGPGPNVGSGVSFNSFGSPLLNANGHVAFVGVLSGTGITTLNNSGIWSNAGGTLAVVARTGSSGPGPNLGAGVNFSSISFPVLNAAGRVAFYGTITGPGTVGSNAGVWTNVSGSLAVVARTGSPGPGPNLGTGVTFNFLNDPVMNAAGQVAFAAGITGIGIDSTNDNGIWTNAGGSLAVVARKGPSGPGPNLSAGIDFTSFSTMPVMNANGHVAFRANVIGTGVDSTNDTGIWTNAGGTIVTVAREGTSGPGPNLGPGVHFSNIGSSNNPVMNAAGQVAFLGFLTGGGVDTTNDRGIWLFSGGVLTPVIREGDPFDVDPGPGVDLRTISLVGFTNGIGSGGEDGRAMTLNDNGMLAFNLSFTDGTSGNFTATAVPEPASLCVGAAGIFFWCRRRGQATPTS